ncbi:MAG: sigma-E factor negative regulatory protein [Gammaproteobacteria bacterium]|nr:sigma-E factor negative regulatory protein [Gammaproteobacteria bacterium]MBU1646592.1 sigma-E factor negative regulatory protein [Gammaproteobacteria bacterium]MBU1972849.1 sigma-E factor negative regulatory protein [Gammaproteobacteria bacterium]
MRTEISALLDGELEVHEAKPALDGLRKVEELRTAWDEYHLIGAALRGEERLATALTARVMAGLEHEVTVLAPPRRRTESWQRPLVALVASLAGVAVVGWVAFAPQLSPAPAGSGHLALATQGQNGVATAVSVAPVARHQMQEYLVAHQAYVSGSQIVGGTQHVRTVAIAEGGQRR